MDAIILLNHVRTSKEMLLSSASVKCEAKDSQDRTPRTAQRSIEDSVALGMAWMVVLVLLASPTYIACGKCTKYYLHFAQLQHIYYRPFTHV